MNLVSFVTDHPLAKLTWHEPPPWTALPVKLNLKVPPGETAGLSGPADTSNWLSFLLQGKSAPCASRGLLLGLPAGTGERIIMCAFVAATSVRR